MSLPPLPEPVIQEAVWHSRGDHDMSWADWYGKDDPMPAKWEGDQPPDVVVPYFTADQMRAYGEACADAERERCAQIAQETVCDVHLPTGVRIYGTKAAAAIRSA